MFELVKTDLVEFKYFLYFTRLLAVFLLASFLLQFFLLVLLCTSSDAGATSS